MNSKRHFQKHALVVKKTCSRRFKKGSVPRKHSKPGKLLWADELTEVFGENRSKWSSPISFTSEDSKKSTKGILKMPRSSR